MFRFSKIPRGRDFWGWPPLVFILTIIAVGLAISASRIGLRALNIAGERRASEERIRQLEAEKAGLEESLRALGSAEAVERMAKEKLNLKQPGEEVVVVVRPGIAAASTSPRSGNFFLKFLPEWIRQFIAFLSR